MGCAASTQAPTRGQEAAPTKAAEPAKTAPAPAEPAKPAPAPLAEPAKTAPAPAEPAKPAPAPLAEPAKTAPAAPAEPAKPAPSGSSKKKVEDVRRRRTQSIDPSETQTDPVRTEAERVFRLADEDGGGTLDLDELCALTGFSRLAEKLLGKLDDDHDGQVTLEQWIEFIVGKGDKADKVLQPCFNQALWSSQHTVRRAPSFIALHRDHGWRDRREAWVARLCMQSAIAMCAFSHSAAVKHAVSACISSGHFSSSASSLSACVSIPSLSSAACSLSVPPSAALSSHCCSCATICSSSARPSMRWSFSVSAEWGASCICFHAGASDSDVSSSSASMSLDTRAAAR